MKRFERDAALENAKHPHRVKQHDGKKYNYRAEHDQQGLGTARRVPDRQTMSRQDGRGHEKCESQPRKKKNHSNVRARSFAASAQAICALSRRRQSSSISGCSIITSGLCFGGYLGTRIARNDGTLRLSGTSTPLLNVTRASAASGA